MSDDTPAGGDPAYGLRWGIKSSFVDYLRRLPDGRGAVSDGAVPVGTGDIFFAFDPTVTPDVAEGQTAWAFRGDVRFTGHFGMLVVRVARPQLVSTSGSAVLSIEASDGSRVPLVTAQLESAGVQASTALWTSSEVRLTSQGVPIFNDVYAEGEPFDPLVVQVPA